MAYVRSKVMNIFSHFCDSFLKQSSEQLESSQRQEQKRVTLKDQATHSKPCAAPLCAKCSRAPSIGVSETTLVCHRQMFCVYDNIARVRWFARRGEGGAGISLVWGAFSPLDRDRRPYLLLFLANSGRFHP